MKPALTDLIKGASWREAVTYRESWPHEYVLSEKDGQKDLLAAVVERFKAGEGVACRFFQMNNTYLFVGDYKYWLMVDYNEVDAYGAEGDYILNRAPSVSGPAGLCNPARRHGSGLRTTRLVRPTRARRLKGGSLWQITSRFCSPI